MLNPNKGSCLLLLPKEYLNFFLCLLFIGTWRFSEKITPIAGNDLGIANGGKTATGVKPNGTKARDCPRVGIVKSFGSPPPFDDPG